MKTLHEADAYVVAELLQMYPGAQSIECVFTIFSCIFSTLCHAVTSWSKTSAYDIIASPICLHCKFSPTTVNTLDSPCHFETPTDLLGQTLILVYTHDIASPAPWFSPTTVSTLDSPCHFETYSNFHHQSPAYMTSTSLASPTCLLHDVALTHRIIVCDHQPLSNLHAYLCWVTSDTTSHHPHPHKCMHRACLHGKILTRCLSWARSSYKIYSRT